MQVIVFLESDDQNETGKVAYDVYIDPDYDPKTGQYMERVTYWVSRGIGVAVTCQDDAVANFDPSQAYLTCLI